MLRSKNLSVLSGVLGLILGTTLLWDSRNSDPSLIFLMVFLGVPAYGIFLLFVHFSGRSQQGFLGTVYIGLTAASVFLTGKFVLQPANIRYEFSAPVNTGSYQKVQFFHKEGTEWKEGPSVEAWPLTVSFPDIDRDGHSDIRVTEDRPGLSSIIEFIYLSNPKNNIFWKPGKMTGQLSASYPPAQVFYNYP